MNCTSIIAAIQCNGFHWNTILNLSLQIAQKQQTLFFISWVHIYTSYNSAFTIYRRFHQIANADFLPWFIRPLSGSVFGCTMLFNRFNWRLFEARSFRKFFIQTIQITLHTQFGFNPAVSRNICWKICAVCCQFFSIHQATLHAAPHNFTKNRLEQLTLVPLALACFAKRRAIREENLRRLCQQVHYYTLLLTVTHTVS